ncbi:GTPase Era [Pararhodospirillum oryzae]|uniref:GTPase Era n=1 Tax=Pararhodospirillum oryzae TaxID=478448 RepID=A0A512H6W8_9PROT|nr:GTPase Era [Pararhodospirillum oryzae]GEO81130.1 GTPase Era [Pararhodospirillum oryzae]
MTTPPAPTEAPTRCGFVAVLGPPNAGKSTLVNQLVGAKVTIVSPKAQTTRTRVRGVALQDNAQVVLVDTPGIFAPRKRFDRAMVAAAWEGGAEADRILLVVDARKGLNDAARAIVERLPDTGRPCLLALNKVDAIERPLLLERAAAFAEIMPFERVFMISALSGSGCADVLTHLAGCVPEGPWMFPEDELSDLPQRLLAAEITREKVFLQLHEELPYAAAVVTESWQERPDGSVRIEQTILVERDTQRAIVLGQGGARIKALGQAARAELMEILERPVHLFLHVKVNERLWEDREQYSAWGLDYNV